METTEAQQPPAADRKPEPKAPGPADDVRDAAATPAGDTGAGDTDVEDLDADDTDDEDDEGGAVSAWRLEPERPRRTVGVGSGAAALVAGGLGLASVSGTWLSTLVKEREQLIGQIASSSKATAVQIAADYGKPWHAYALVNGIVAVLAVLLAVGVLAFTSNWLAVARPALWVRAVAWAGLALGVIGLLIAGAMFFDVFTSLPAVAAAGG